MSLQDQQAVFAQNVALLISYIFNRRYKCTLGEAWRTPEQAEIYAKEGKGIKNSLHCQRLAIDLNIFSPTGELLTKPEEYMPFGLYWQKLNSYNKWGGEFRDANGNLKPDSDHFEMHYTDPTKSNS